MSGANTIDLHGGTFTLGLSDYTDPAGNSVPGGVVVNNSPGNETLDINVSWAYVIDSRQLTIYSLIINGFTQGDTLDYTPSGVLTAVGGEQASLQSLAPGGGITDLGTYSVDGLSVVGIEVPVTVTTSDLATTAANIDLLLVPGPSATAFSVSDLQVFGDGAQGFDITSTQPCYCAGTRIRTPTGETAIEALRPGDLVFTVLDGVPQAVVWVGRRVVDCGRHPRAWDVRPVRVQAHAFGPGRPRRDLWLSPDHAVFVKDDGEGAAPGVLVPIRYLINGATVVQEDVARVTYYHLELPRHDVVLAEGLPAESFLDTGNRRAFDNGGPAVELQPDFARREAQRAWAHAACAPLVTGGAELEGARERLRTRAVALGHAIIDDPDLRLIAGGLEIAAERQGDVYRVRIPAAAGSIRVISRSAIPAEIETNGRDRRRLGVGVARVTFNGQDIVLGDPRLSSGWHEIESGWRWTDGDAGLALAGGGVLEISVVMAGPYWMKDAVMRERAGM